MTREQVSPNAHRKYYVTGRYLHCCCMSSRVVKHGTAVDFKKNKGGAITLKNLPMAPTLSPEKLNVVLNISVETKTW